MSLPRTLIITTKERSVSGEFVRKLSLSSRIEHKSQERAKAKMDITPVLRGLLYRPL